MHVPSTESWSLPVIRQVTPWEVCLIIIAVNPGAKGCAMLPSSPTLKSALTFSSQACRSTACVWMQTPSTASTSTSAPSLSRTAVDTWCI